MGNFKKEIRLLKGRENVQPVLKQNFKPNNWFKWERDNQKLRPETKIWKTIRLRICKLE